MASELVRFTVAVTEGLLHDFDEYTARRGSHANRSEAVRDLMREQMAGREVDDPDANVVGSITMVYDHHTPDLGSKLDDIQHHHLAQIVSTTHVHLDHHNCLEILAVRGRSSEVHDLADCLLGTKGVRHGKLACTSIE